jgi:MFS family permease
MSLLTHLVPHATDLDIPATTAANMVSVIGILTIVGRLVMGGAADRFGNKKVLAASYGLVSLAIFWLLLAREEWMLYIFSGIYGFVYAGLGTMASPLLAEMFGLRSLGLIFGIINLGFTVGGALGPAITGYIFDITGSYNLAFIACAVLALVSLMMTYLLKPINKSEGLLDNSF